LEELKSQIQNANQMLDVCRLSCQKEIRKMLQLHRQNMGLYRLLRQFKNNNEDYIRIQDMAKQTVRNVLSDRQLLKFALLSLIESLRTDRIRFDFLIHGKPPPLTMSKSTVMDHPGRSSEHSIKTLLYSKQNSYTETLTEVIVNGAASLYEKMVKDSTNVTMTNASADNSSKCIISMRWTMPY
jgi:hypothetical protein